MSADVSGKPAAPASFICAAVEAREEDASPVSSVTYSAHLDTAGSLVGVASPDRLAGPAAGAASPKGGDGAAARMDLHTKSAGVETPGRDPSGGSSCSGVLGSNSPTAAGGTHGGFSSPGLRATSPPRADPTKFAAVARPHALAAAGGLESGGGGSSSRGDAVLPDVVMIKLVIYAGMNMEGRKLYCKFYHGNCKHKTSAAAARRNPEWKEWFSIAHFPLKQTPILRIEVWGGGFLGKEVKGFCDVDLSPVLYDSILIDGLYDVRGCGGQIRVKLINMDLLPRWERTIAAEAALRAIGEDDPEGVLALMVDDLKRRFPAVPYEEIAVTLRAHDWKKALAATELANRGPQRVKATLAIRKHRTMAVDGPGQGCLSLNLSGAADSAKHESFMERKKRQQIREVARMLPDVDVEEVEFTLRANNWNLCAAVDELILAHRDTEAQPESKTEDIRITKLETLAQAGGFVAVEQHKGSLEVRHSSALRPVREGVGDKKFQQRRMVFEREKPNA
ncbi:hypothetical protein BESB_045820 [Besnoitia besnoiti]|uniref:CUE domain-containing protein n=1 Tax=Besnoitia besnoiti TaxID=94643 RepID=A0A2A9MLN7_BESBE|nr:hypothetical protein BESB_045820 [Besnoitia besnoiti]PFH36390.1 hypothetical protein BESB_045820 [Besnoitia besnoiti]